MAIMPTEKLGKHYVIFILYGCQIRNTVLMKICLFDFEYYDERWDCQLGAAQMEIYIPVKKMGE